MSKSLTRRTVSDDQRNHGLWPSLDFDALGPDAREWALARQRAIIAYLANYPLKDIKKDCGLNKTQVLRAFNRCLAQHTDGRIYGWRALPPGVHVKDYQRVAPAGRSKGGKGGVFTLFLRTYPQIAEKLAEVILKAHGGDAIRESRSSHRETYGHFRRMCLREGIATTMYPFTNRDGGEGAIRRHAKNLLRSHFAAEALRRGGKNAAVRARIGRGIGHPRAARHPYDIVSIDAHRLDFVGCIALPTPLGEEIIPIERLSVIPVADIYSAAVLGYRVAIDGDPSAHDVGMALRHALSEWRPRKLTLPGMSYPNGAGLPSGLIPQLRGVCWNAIYLDNATIHCSSAVADGVRRALGCALNFGAVGEWFRRPLSEGIFSSMARGAFHRLPNTMGSGPHDPHRSEPAEAAVKYAMTLDKMLDLLDVVICTYNATPKPSLGGLSPLEVLTEAALTAPTRWLPRRLPALPAHVPDLCTLVLTPTVRGSALTGVRPYVQYAGVRYSSPVLSGVSELIGKRIRLHIRCEDISHVKAFLDDGAELGILNAMGGWDRTPHNLKLRQAVLKAIRERRLVLGPMADPVQEFLHLLAQEALTKHQNRKSAKQVVSRDATALTRAVRVAHQPIPEVAHTVVSAPALTFTDTTTALPSFIPRLRHRGVQK